MMVALLAASPAAMRLALLTPARRHRSCCRLRNCSRWRCLRRQLRSRLRKSLRCFCGRRLARATIPTPLHHFLTSLHLRACCLLSTAHRRLEAVGTIRVFPYLRLLLHDCRRFRRPYSLRCRHLTPQLRCLRLQIAGISFALRRHRRSSVKIPCQTARARPVRPQLGPLRILAPLAGMRSSADLERTNAGLLLLHDSLQPHDRRGCLLQLQPNRLTLRFYCLLSSVPRGVHRARQAWRRTTRRACR